MPSDGMSLETLIEQVEEKLADVTADGGEVTNVVDDETLDRLTRAWNTASIEERRRVRRENDLESLTDKWSMLPWSSHEPESGAAPSPEFDTLEAGGREILSPSSVEEVESILEKATNFRTEVKPVGWEQNYHGHSFSNVNRPTEYGLSLHEMSGKSSNKYGVDPETLCNDVDERRLYATEGGTAIRTINSVIGVGENRRALANIGAYDGQTIAGAVATDTHGSGVDLGPLSTLVRSLTLVTTGGKTLRIEPDDDITNRTRHESKYPELELIKNNELFNAVTVGLGCMGVVTSLVLETEDYYWLEETRESKSWSTVKQNLKEGAHEEVRHYQVAINPYRRDGNRRCLVTHREKHDKKPTGLTHRQRKRSFLFRLSQTFGFVEDLMLKKLLNQPDKRGQLIERGLEVPTDETYISSWDNVLLLGLESTDFESMEVGVPACESTQWVETVDAVLDRLEPDGDGDFHPTAPVSLRFVGESDAYLSPQFGRETTCMIEIPFMRRQSRGSEEGEVVRRVIREMEEFLIDCGGRPHWGKLNYMNWPKLQKAWGTTALDNWLDAYARFNSRGVFNNDFTDQLGISMRPE